MAKDEVPIRSKFVTMMMMTPDFKERLRLPSAYCEKLKLEKSKRAILESPKGRWEMNVRRDDDGEIFFEDGWSRFLDEHAVNAVDILMFEHTGNLHFNVVICDHCEKQFLGELRNLDTRDIAKRCKGSEEKKGVVSLHEEMPYFTQKMTPYTSKKIAMLNIPLEFANSNGLANKEGVVLRDPLRKTWRLKLLVQKDGERVVRVLMKSGWHDLYVANELKVGDLCLFKLNPTSSSTSTTVLFDVQIFPN